MDKITCNIIKDLLPLYSDGVCSEDSKETIEEHLKECEECSKALQEGVDQFIPLDTPKAEVEKAVKKTAKKIKKDKKKAVIKALSVVFAVLICTSFLGYFKITKEMYHQHYFDLILPAKSSKIEISKSEGKAPNTQTKFGSFYLDESHGKYEIKEENDFVTFNFEDGKIIRILKIDSSGSNKNDKLFPTTKYARAAGREWWYQPDIIKKGLELAGFDTTYSPGYSLELYKELIEYDPTPTGKFSIKEFLKEYGYYGAFYLSVGAGFDMYITSDHPDFHCLGFAMFGQDQTLYAMEMQKKDNLDIEYTFLCKGFTQAQFEEMYHSLILK